MAKRIITAIIALIVFIPILIFSDTWIFPLAMAFASLAGCYEMFSCIGQRRNIWLALPIYLCAVFFPLSVRFSYISGWSASDLVMFAMGIALIMAVYIFGVSVFANKKVSVNDVGLIYSTCFYIIAAFASIVYLRDYFTLGKYIYLLVFICAWMTDCFAYFTGRLFGKHKLIESVSPKKTIEGSIGGVVFCVISTVIFGLIIDMFFDPLNTVRADYLVLAVSGIFLSVVSQTGDLIMSVIKRRYGIKDYGKLFPGHGGILDRFDSVIAVSLMLAFICTYFPLFA